MTHPRTYLVKLALILGLIISCESQASFDEEYQNSSEIHGGGQALSLSIGDDQGPSNNNYNWASQTFGQERDLSDFVDPDNVVVYEDDAEPLSKGKRPAPAKEKEEFEFPSIELSDEVAKPVKKAAVAPTPAPKRAKVTQPAKPALKSSKTVGPQKKPAEKKRARADQDEDDDSLMKLIKERAAAKNQESAKTKSAPQSIQKPAKAIAAAAPANDNLKHPERILRVVNPNEHFLGKTVAILDFETTSFSPGIGGRAVSLGIMLIKNGVETLRWEAIFNPGKDSNKGAFKAHGISRSVTRHKPYFHEQQEEIFGILSQADVVVAHNAKFDYRYLLAEFQQANILKKVKGWKLGRLLGDNSPLNAIDREFMKQQLAWVNEDPHIQAKRLSMLQNRLSTAMWLYLEARKVLTDNYLYDPASGRFGVPFLPTADKSVTGYAKSVNEALQAIFVKLSVLEPKTQGEKDRLSWKKFDGIDISERDEFTPVEKRRKEMFDRQIKAVNVVKKFTFLELGWDKVYDWRRVGDKKSVFYNQPDKDCLNQITGFLNLAKALVDNGLYKHNAEVPAFLDYERTWADTYAMAKQKLRKGQDITGYKLDDLCDFYGVDRSSRKDGHGALIDSDLLAKVYAHLCGTEMEEVAVGTVNDNKRHKQALELEPMDLDDEAPVAATPKPAAKKPAKVPVKKKKDTETDLIGGVF